MEYLSNHVSNFVAFTIKFCTFTLHFFLNYYGFDGIKIGNLKKYIFILFCLIKKN